MSLKDHVICKIGAQADVRVRSLGKYMGTSLLHHIEHLMASGFHFRV